MSRYDNARLEMVRTQIVARGITDPAVVAAMSAVPREEFVAEHLRDAAYDDCALPIPSGQTISQPYVVAHMIDALDLPEEARVLEVGTGSGYAAAVLGEIAAQVHTVERDEELAIGASERLNRLGITNVEVHHGDGTLGWADGAPYDGIVVAAGGPRVPDALLDQLASPGVLVMPVGSTRTMQRLLKLARAADGSTSERVIGRVRFVPLVGVQAWREAGRPWPFRLKA